MHRATTKGLESTSGCVKPSNHPKHMANRDRCIRRQLKPRIRTRTLVVCCPPPATSLQHPRARCHDRACDLEESFECLQGDPATAVAKATATKGGRALQASGNLRMYKGTTKDLESTCGGVKPSSQPRRTAKRARHIWRGLKPRTRTCPLPPAGLLQIYTPENEATIVLANSRGDRHSCRPRLRRCRGSI
jgi:hypothetical protein